MIKEKVALVTGGNRGIGFEICRQLAQKGIRVILTARNEEKGKAATERLREKGLNVIFHQIDVTDEESISRAEQYVKKSFGRLDILINNAGIAPDYSYNGLNADIDLIRRTMETNVYGPLRICKVFIPIMQKHNSGRIINISSHMGSLNIMGSDAPGYRMSKTALNALTRILAHELRYTNIWVNSISPGWVRTEMGGPQAPDSVEKGAYTAVWLATCENPFNGKFFEFEKEIPW